MPTEVWAVILQYFDYIDILCIRFLSKRLFKISFLNTRFKYFQCLARQLTDCDVFYEKMKALFQNFITKVKSDISLSDWLYLNYVIDNLKGDLLISSCFCHLFHCPRSLFAKNDCRLCSRKYILNLITKPENFSRLFDFSFGDRLLKEYQNISFEGLKSSLFYKSYDEFKTIQSDKKRCLTTCVITSPCKLGRLFLEVILRILINSSYDFANNLSQSQQFVFLQKYFDSIVEYLPNIIAEFDYNLFIKIFLENDYNSFHFKITNQNFLNYCSKKYAC